VIVVLVPAASVVTVKERLERIEVESEATALAPVGVVAAEDLPESAYHGGILLSVNAVEFSLNRAVPVEAVAFRGFPATRSIVSLYDRWRASPVTSEWWSRDICRSLFVPA
jgi:hypothetical protein